MKAEELIHNGLYYIHELGNDIVVRYDAIKHSFVSKYYEYSFEVANGEICAKDPSTDTLYFLKPIRNFKIE